MAIIVRYDRAAREQALTPEQWEELCKFLEMPLHEVLSLPGPQLLRRVRGVIDGRRRRQLIRRVLPQKLPV
jgi:hypothetical protein